MGSGTRAAIEEVRRASRDEWDRQWRACAHATYFHSRDWAETWAAYRPRQLEPDARLIRFEDGVEVVLPLTRQRLLRGMASRWWCSPMGTYGGWLCPSPIDESHSDALCDYVHERLGCVSWRLNPYDPCSSRIAAAEECEPDETLVLALDCAYPELEAACAHGHRRAAHKAARCGVNVRPAASPGDWAAYVATYRDTLRRWGEEAGFGPVLFEEMRRRAGEWLTLWVAEVEGEIVGGLVCLYAPNHVACWHSAVREDAMPMHPMHRVFLTAIEDACGRGIAWFDFNPSRGLTGVMEFKRRFGARPLACPVVTCERGIGIRAWRLLRHVPRPRSVSAAPTASAQLR